MWRGESSDFFLIACLARRPTRSGAAPVAAQGLLLDLALTPRRSLGFVKDIAEGGDHATHRERRGGANGADRAGRKPGRGGRAADRPAVRGQAARLRPGGLSGADPDHLLSALVAGGRGQARRLLRDRDAGAGDPAALRRGAAPRPGLLPGLRRADPRRRGRAQAALQHRDPGRQGRAGRRQVPQDPPAGPCRVRASSAAFQHLEKRYFEVGNLGFPGVAGASAATAGHVRSATTGAGPRPSGSWACRTSSW